METLETSGEFSSFFNNSTLWTPEFRSKFHHDWLIKESGWPWLEIPLADFPFEAALDEARSLKNMFVDHRENEGSVNYRHQGWKSLCLHGLSAQKTQHFTYYGIEHEEKANYQWTEIAAQCPETTKYFKEIFPAENYHRIRFMLLEPGGQIFPHRDRENHFLGPLNISLNMPEGCLFQSEKGRVPFRDRSAFLLDIGYEHAVWNESTEDRYHIIVHCDFGNRWFDFIEIVRRGYETFKSQN